MSRSLAGARVAMLGEFSSAEARQRCLDHAAAEGAAVAAIDDRTVTHVIRGEITRRLAERLGPTPREREFVKRGVIVLEESTCAGADSSPVRTGEASDLSPFRATVLDSTASASSRHVAATALVACGSPEALAVLHEALRDPGIDRTIEARAFGQLVVRGVSRFSRSAPFAIEFPLRRTRGSDGLVDTARGLGSVESYCDDSGRRWCRVRLALPSPRIDDARVLAACLDFIDRIARRRDARVWIAGFAIPARLGRDGWTAVLATVAGR